MNKAKLVNDIPWIDDSSKGINIAVVGDIILDEYLDGRVDRISPEAPVPVHLVKNRTYTPGGAANAARNIKLAGGNATLFSVAGKDEAFDLLKKVYEEEGMNTDGILTVEDRPTIRKTRITTNAQQLVRIDWERVSPITSEQQSLLYNRMVDSDFDAILVSDYGKGALPNEFIKKIIELGHSRKVPIIIDPKGTDFDKYYGATLIKPNHKEACEALGLDPTVERDGEELARGLCEKFNFATALVTLGARGMVHVSAEGDVIQRKASAKEVFDVSGAGDCVAALVTLGAACKNNWESTIEIANLGAGIVVEKKWGTQPVTLAELAEAIESKDETLVALSSSHKLLSLEQAKTLFASPKFHDKSMVFTNGCFDILHAGHLSYLEKARAKGDYLVVGVNSDESISRLKGPSRPVVDQKNRLALLAGLWCVDYIVVFGDDTPEKLINELTPQVLTKGADWDVSKIVGGQHVLNNGGRVETVELVDRYFSL